MRLQLNATSREGLTALRTTTASSQAMSAASNVSHAGSPLVTLAGGATAEGP
jgi:hypothetical protein